MQTGFTSNFFTGNRKKLIEKCEGGLIVIAANGLLQRSADTTFPFRQDSNFWYLTGIDEPDYVLVVTDSEEFLIAPKRSEHRDLWDGEIDAGAIRQVSGVEEIVDYHEGWNRLDQLVKKQKKIYTIAPAETYFEHFGFYANPARSQLLEALAKHKKSEVVDIRKIIAWQRQIKQPVEVEALKKAIEITVETLNEISVKLPNYKTEYEVAADITSGFMKRGSKGHAYQPIVASGKHAATIHYVSNDGILAQSQLLLLDVGAELDNYSADITRTYSLGNATQRQKDIYNAVLRVRQKAIDILKPGVMMKDFEQKVDGHMAKELKKLGLLDDISDKRKLKKYYPHLTSHFLGLDTHDAADYLKPLEPGMVLTVEPGIYIPEEEIGIRVEDDVLVTKNGVEVLSTVLPVGLG